MKAMTATLGNFTERTASSRRREGNFYWTAALLVSGGLAILSGLVSIFLMFEAVQKVGPASPAVRAATSVSTLVLLFAAAHCLDKIKERQVAARKERVGALLHKSF